ncbi:MAG TPA: adenylate/guanylate cyclase domain-containing protein [Candidatus Sericytochromatia bacterium]
MEAPIPENEATRLKALRQLQILDSPPEAGFDDLTRLAALLCGTPTALVSLVDANRQWFKSKVGIEASETPRCVAFCAHTILQPDILIIPDALADKRFATNPLVTNPPHIRFYAGVPLITGEGQALGSLCVIDYVPRKLEPYQVEALQALGRQVVVQLELRRSLTALARTITERQRGKKTRKRFFKRIAGGLGAAAIILVAMGAISYRNTNRVVETMTLVETQQQVSGKIQDLLSKLTETESDQRGYLLAGQDAYLKSYQAAIAEVEQSLKDLRQLTANNPPQQQKLHTLEPLIARRLALLNKGIDLRRQQNFEAALQVVLSGEGTQLMDEIQTGLTQMKNEQESLLQQRTQAIRKQRIELFIFLLGIFLVLVVLAEVYYFIDREIAERQEVEEVLSAERDFVSAVLDTASALIVVLDPEGRIIRFNRACEQLTRYSLAEVRGKFLWDLFIVSEEVEPVKAIFEELRNDQFPGESENYWITKDENRRLIVWSGNALKNANSSVKYFIVAGIDITERQQAEAALRRSETQNRAFLEALQESKTRLQSQQRALMELAKSQPLYSGDISAAVSEIIKTAAQTLEIERASVWFYNNDRSKLHCVKLHERSTLGYSEGMELAVADYPVYFQALELQRVLAADYAYSDPRTHEFSASYLAPLGIKSMLDVPIRLGGSTVGVLCLEHVGEPRHWKLEEQNFASSLAYMATLAMEARNRKQAEEALRAEKEKSELLLLNILPSEIANRLKYETDSIADSFADVTVLFADIVGFTELSCSVTPIELVKLLNRIFSTFDLLAEKHGLEKIKTIGDAYMVVGGLPTPRADHAEAMANMALDMQREIAHFNAKTGNTFSIRIGINTGPAIAGVIGIKKFIYDLWGDTVNTASRMESHGIPGSIQVTQVTYERLRENYLFEERGVIQVKGKGEMTTYLLIGKKSTTEVTQLSERSPSSYR